MSDKPADRVRIRQLWPLLPVTDMVRSIRFYRDALGFSVVGLAEDAGTPYWCRLERDGACIMLEVDGSGRLAARGARPVALYFVCDDADAMYAELKERGLAVETPSTAQYGMRQLPVPEPDGHELWFESPTLEWKS